MRRAAKRDSSESSIVRVLRQVGCLVLYNDHPDLIVQRDGTLYLIEVKARTGKLTDSQKKLIEDGWNLHVVRSVDEALEAVGIADPRALNGLSFDL